MAIRRPPVLFCNTAWMNEYKGNVKTDPPFNGGSWIQKHGTGFEIHNFLPHRGRVYGYVANAPHFTIAIEKLGAQPGDESVGGVRVIWTATRPKGGRFVIGWYDNATVFRNMEGRNHPDPGLEMDTQYIVSANAGDAHLVGVDDRASFPIPDCRRPGVAWGMGQSNVRFMDANGLEFLRGLEGRLGAAGIEPAARSKGGQGRQPDIFKRLQVEQAAMETVTAFFERDWELIDKTRELGLGYDLLAKPRAGRRIRDLFLEVKGCSGSGVGCELTPSERTCMHGLSTREQYRLCVVTEALDPKRRRLHVFRYHPGVRKWTADGGLVLRVEDILAARCSAG